MFKNATRFIKINFVKTRAQVNLIMAIQTL